MIFPRLQQIFKNQKGVTLVELLVVIAIAGPVTYVIVTAIYQLFSVNAMDTAHMSAVNEVDNAIHWINRDAQMAQNVNATALTGFPLTLTWVEWDNTANTVVYAVQNGELRRSLSQNGGVPKTTVIVHHVDPDQTMTNCTFSGGVFEFKITSSLGGFRPQSETRSFKVIPRPAQ